MAFVHSLTRREVLKVAGVAVAANAAGEQMAVGKIKAIGFDAFTIFDFRSIDVAFAATGGWDAAGAKAFAYNIFWVNHSNAPVEELTVKPDAIGNTQKDLAKYVMA